LHVFVVSKLCVEPFTKKLKWGAKTKNSVKLQ